MIPKRVVLDTNICLDLFVFRDPRWKDLLAALKNGELDAVTRPDCRSEWLAVLNYPHLPLQEDTRARAVAEFDALITCLEPPVRSTPLPLCHDRDDQKFLELARDAGASVLISKDKALLKLGRRTVRAGLFQILAPERWLAAAEVTMPASLSLSA